MILSLLFKLGIYKVYPVVIEENVESIVWKCKKPLSKKNIELYKYINTERLGDMEQGFFLYAIFKNNDDTGIRVRLNVSSSTTGIIAINLYSNEYFKATHEDNFFLLTDIHVAKTVLSNRSNWFRATISKSTATVKNTSRYFKR